jgi:hypothetical protein
MLRPNFNNTIKFSYSGENLILFTIKKMHLNASRANRVEYTNKTSISRFYIENIVYNEGIE